MLEFGFQAYGHSNWLPIVIMHALATWRISYALVHETGPYWLLTRLRSKTGIVHDETGQPIAWPDNSVLSCIWCSSVWVSIVLMAVPLVMWLIFGVSALAILFNERLNK